MEVRAISIRQPWCEAVVDGHKPVENRRRGFPARFRGIVLLHAALSLSMRGAVDPRILALNLPDPDDWTTGAVLGHAELVDVHPDVGCCRPWGESEYLEHDGTRRAVLCHLIFERPVRYEHPIRARGRLGLWKPSRELLAECAL